MPAIRKPRSLRSKIAILAAAGGVVGSAGAIAIPASAQPVHPADIGLGVVTVTYYHNDGNGLTEDGTQLVTVLADGQCATLTPPTGANYYQVDDAIGNVQEAAYASDNCSGTIRNFAGADELSYQDMLPSDASILSEAIS